MNDEIDERRARIEQRNSEISLAEAELRLDEREARVKQGLHRLQTYGPGPIEDEPRPHRRLCLHPFVSLLFLGAVVLVYALLAGCAPAPTKTSPSVASTTPTTETTTWPWSLPSDSGDTGTPPPPPPPPECAGNTPLLYGVPGGAVDSPSTSLLATLGNPYPEGRVVCDTWCDNFGVPGLSALSVWVAPAGDPTGAAALPFELPPNPPGEFIAAVWVVEVGEGMHGATADCHMLIGGGEIVHARVEVVP